VTRVANDSEDSADLCRATVEVSPTILDASSESLLDAIAPKLIENGARPA
jgi:hypothetical protein